jgi:hypothetical protein
MCKQALQPCHRLLLAALITLHHTTMANHITMTEQRHGLTCAKAALAVPPPPPGCISSHHTTLGNYITITAYRHGLTCANRRFQPCRFILLAALIKHTNLASNITNKNQ